MMFFCGTCRQEKPTSDFYLKYKNRPPLRRSDWTSTCAPCTKEYKKRYYIQNKERLDKEHKERRKKNLKKYLALEAARRLAHSQNPGQVLRRRSIQALDPTRRYIHRRFLSWKISSRKRCLDWDLTEEDILSLWEGQKGLCFYLEEPLVLGPGSRQTLSLDRVDSTLGYIKGNVALCGATINKMKLDLDVEEFALVAARFAKLHATRRGIKG